MDLGLKNKVVIVTGGARGIGSGICEVFAQEGANVVVNYRSKQEESIAFAERLAKEYGVKTLPIQADVSDEKEIMRIFEETYKVFKTIDVVVNNAYSIYGSKGPIEAFETNKFRMVERVVVEAAMITSRELIKHCKEMGKVGHIVNVSSKSAFWTSSPNHSSYIAVKGALAAVTRGLAREVAKDNIYVNAIIPGYVLSSRTDVNSEKYKRVIKYIPSKRYGTPLEIGYIVAFICSEKANQMNGVLLDCTGGTMSGQM